MLPKAVKNDNMGLKADVMMEESHITDEQMFGLFDTSM
jgi:hypothetical protein